MSNSQDRDRDDNQRPGNEETTPIRESQTDFGLGRKAIDWDFCSKHNTRYPSGGSCPQCP